ncbi:Nramp family divalent metal transporter [Luteitalea sp.]|jgi:Mn2+/Fe2+ NRAMP family transporter|uniref:Nramp family divalent metal transporter n=1 Tax=Luteitalea sp. TaxID=2004800 RepID=UPI0037CB1B28
MAVAPPTTLAGRLAQLGPGLIISAAIVGSGELIVIPKLGAAMGFTLLWFVILGCVLKVFVQVELARHAIAHQETTLVSLDTIPGPRWRVSWVLWAWMLMYAGTVLQVGGIIGGITMICGMLGLNWPPWVWLVLTTGSGIALLVSGRYGPVERYSTAMVAIFTLSAMVAVVALQWTEFHVTAAQWREGLSLHMPDSFTIAFAAFGVTGVGASELIYYPYWCLEKGYGRSVGPPPPGGAWSPQRPAWTAGALGWLRVMRLDAFVSMIIYTFATIAFYVLGAAILHQTARDVSDNDLIGRLADMYLRSLGEWSYVLFLVGALAVLYSTFFVATASNARLLVDVGGLLGVPAAAAPTAEARRKAVQAACVLLPLASATAYVVWPQPVTLVLIGAVGQGIMLPLLAVAAVYFRHKRLPPDLAPSTGWTVALWISAGLMTLVGLYQLLRTIGAI